MRLTRACSVWWLREFAGQVVEVGEDMHFRLRIPADTRGVLPVRVVRPDGTVLVLRVEVVDD